MEKVREYYDKIDGLIQGKKRKEEEGDVRSKELIDAATAVPSLFAGNDGH